MILMQEGLKHNNFKPALRKFEKLLDIGTRATFANSLG
jgi:hypothetical protein